MRATIFADECLRSFDGRAPCCTDDVGPPRRPEGDACWGPGARSAEREHASRASSPLRWGQPTLHSMELCVGFGLHDLMFRYFGARLQNLKDFLKVWAVAIVDMGRPAP